MAILSFWYLTIGEQKKKMQQISKGSSILSLSHLTKMMKVVSASCWIKIISFKKKNFFGASEVVNPVADTLLETNCLWKLSSDLSILEIQSWGILNAEVRCLCDEQFFWRVSRINAVKTKEDFIQIKHFPKVTFPHPPPSILQSVLEWNGSKISFPMPLSAPPLPLPPPQREKVRNPNRGFQL